MGVSTYTARRRKSSWTTHTKTGKPVVARAKARSWGVTRVTTPRLPKEVSGYAKRFSEGVAIEKARNPELSQLEVEARVRDNLMENPYHYQKKKVNPAEIRGQQLRIRVLEPKKKARYRVHDVGRRGRLQLTLMDGQVQSYVLNLKDYPTKNHVLFEIGHLRLTPSQKAKAVSLVNKYWRGKK